MSRYGLILLGLALLQLYMSRTQYTIENYKTAMFCSFAAGWILHAIAITEGLLG